MKGAISTLARGPLSFLAALSLVSQWGQHLGMVSIAVCRNCGNEGDPEKEARTAEQSKETKLQARTAVLEAEIDQLRLAVTNEKEARAFEEGALLIEQ